jgi:transposase-like protein
MQHIVAGILLLAQHLITLKENSNSYRLNFCPHCGIEGVWNHGHYDRKSDRSGELNPIFILRFLCPHCKKTHSVLPECIPPRRWYMWSIQQSVLLKMISGEGIRATSRSEQPSLSTCKRWLARLKNQFLAQRDALCAHAIEFARFVDFEGFWKNCLNKISLGRAMLLCNQAGVCIP